MKLFVISIKISRNLDEIKITRGKILHIFGFHAIKIRDLREKIWMGQWPTQEKISGVQGYGRTRRGSSGRTPHGSQGILENLQNDLLRKLQNALF